MKTLTKSFITLGLVLVIASLFSAMNTAEPVAANIILQSKDGGQTWEDISSGLPHNVLPEDFLAGESEILIRIENGIYRRKLSPKVAGWEKEKSPSGESVDLNRAGIKKHDFQGQVFQNAPPEEGAWLPVYTNFGGQSMRSVFETTDGSIVLGYRHGHFKSVDNGQTWTQIPKDSNVTKMLGSNGVSVLGGVKKVGKYLICGHPDGIFRSADMGKTWNKVHSGIDKKELIDIGNSSKDPKEMFAIYVSGDITYAVARSGKGC